jgi:acetylornithine deacetylase/succinyl-diaminopimelate desuccinylase-like protein
VSLRDLSFRQLKSTTALFYGMKWIVDGYDTMLQEIDEQAPVIIQEPIDFIFVPVGVGSFAQAVVTHYKSLRHAPKIIAVEPDSAACLKSALQAGKVTTISTGDSVMAGMNCATMTTIALPVLKAGLEAVTTVSDFEAHLAVQELEVYGVRAGPCGAATLAALRSLTAQACANLGIGARSNIVLLCSEGSREYSTPRDVSIDDPVALTQALVRINSSNPGLSSTGVGEKEITEFVAAWLAHHGFDVHRLEKHPGRLSLVGVGRGSGGGRSLMFNGHVDTVTLDSYEGDPLSGHIRDGSVFGRGSFDMKAGLAASMVAAVRARTSGIRGDIIVAAVADEECGSTGTMELLDAGWRADGAIVSEPSHLEVTLSHRGFVWFDVDIIGKAAHGSRPELGVDAIVYAGYFLVELDKYAQELAIQPRHPLLGTGTVHASLITGGEEYSSYPALCTISIERRTVAGETELVVQEQLRTILDALAARLPDFTYRLRTGLCRNAFEADRENVLTKIMLREVEKTMGHPPVIRAEPFWTDAALLAEKGIPALLFGVDGGGAHAATEWATIDSIEKVTATLVRVAQDFCR